MIASVKYSGTISVEQLTAAIFGYEVHLGVRRRRDDHGGDQIGAF